MDNLTKEELEDFVDGSFSFEGYEGDQESIPANFFVPDLAKKIFDRIETNQLNMDLWFRVEDESVFKDYDDGLICHEIADTHMCGTTGCLAGWAVHFANPEVRSLIDTFEYSFLGYLIFLKSLGEVPSFYKDNDYAKDFIQKYVDKENQ
jgi:hypothetical protein